MAAFLASLVFVVLAEMGDMTQLATISLAVKHNAIWSAWMGATAGMMMAAVIGIGAGGCRGSRWRLTVAEMGFGAAVRSGA